MELQEGDVAPDFTLPADNGETVALKDLKDKKVVLYFYPKDNTPGCTAEACSFRDHHADITAAGAVVLGISTDGLASHQRFIRKHDLNFTLLSDEGSEVATAYGAWGEKVLFGHRFTGMRRMTFLIEDGKITKVWRKVKTAGHGAEVLEAVRATS